MAIMHIGIDDTDSVHKGCTTYVAALLVQRLLRLGAQFIDYPNLVRLNPNVPWKTRGNGAVCLRIRCEEDLIDDVKETVVETVEQQSDLSCPGTDPGIVFFRSLVIPEPLKVFARDAVRDVVKFETAMILLKRLNVESVGYNGGRGIIGALAAVGETFEDDYTLEVLAYRTSSNCGSKRRVDLNSIFEMDKRTMSHTFNNLDPERRRVMITPRGPDPVFFGIRGETAEAVKEAYSLVKPLEPVERWVIFRTNQGTDAHLQQISSLADVRPYISVIAKGTVSKSPRSIPLRHVIFSLKDDKAEIDCAAFEPTGILSKVARQLARNDAIEVLGGVKLSRLGSLTINLEKLRILELASVSVLRNPLCPNCGKRLKSMGKRQGFRCEKCASKNHHAKKVRLKVERQLRRGLYVTATRSQRHLTKPLCRYGKEKKNTSRSGMIREWHFP